MHDQVIGHNSSLMCTGTLHNHEKTLHDGECVAWSLLLQHIMQVSASAEEAL